jgi:ribosomal protein S18 acetylase RimI-like enzyme
MQGQGAGTAVHDAFLDELHSRRFEQAALWVLQTNQRARGWYISRGWRPDGALADWVSEGVAHPEARFRISLPHRAP